MRAERRSSGHFLEKQPNQCSISVESPDTNRQSNPSVPMGTPSAVGSLNSAALAGNGLELYGDDRYRAGGEGGRLQGRETASYRTWAQQTEEGYQLQLALALRLSLEAKSAADPNFLDSGTNECWSRSFSASPEVVSHRFWVNGCLSYCDKVPDGFYLIHGMDPYVWTISTDLDETGRIPSFDSLKAVGPSNDLPIEVVLIDKSRDSGLKELETRVLSLSRSWVTEKEAVDQLAELVCNRMGGVASTGEDSLGSCSRRCTEALKDRLGSVVIPIGSLSTGFCVHRALLFKVLADIVELPCRITKGCRYCGQDSASSCLVRFGLDREYLVDLIGKPGTLCQPDSYLKVASSFLVSSPLRHPRFKTVEAVENFSMLSKLYFHDSQSPNIAFDDASSGAVTYKDDAGDIQFPKLNEITYTDRNNSVPILSEDHESSMPPLHQRAAWPVPHVRYLQMHHVHNPISNATNSSHFVKGPTSPSQLPSFRPRNAWRISNMRPISTNNSGCLELNQLISGRSHELHLDEEDLDIPWSDIVLKEKIGAGSFGTFHRAEWQNSDVAVKILMEQDFHAEHFMEFLREVAIMKRLRHPNIVLFMGAVTQPPNLSIVTEYLSRGSLYELLHIPNAEAMLDYKLRLNMAYDVAKGMNYLHQCKPPIVHRDLKSPNLLVDSKFTVKVSDFGLSRSKANTFLSSQTAAGTPEWMAPEVLCDEPSNEKSDVYSFGVILWELSTLQQPWRNLNPTQVVAAVGFRGKRLEIPQKVDPQVAALIRACWDSDPLKRPSFSVIMECLSQLILNSTRQQVHGRIPQIT